MSDLKLKQNGLRILDSRDGDLMIVNPALNISCLFTVAFIEQAEKDPQKMAVLGKKFVEFVKRHTAARWKVVKAEIFQLQSTTPQPSPDWEFINKISLLSEDGTIDALRKIEKDLYFWKEKHARSS